MRDHFYDVVAIPRDVIDNNNVTQNNIMQLLGNVRVTVRKIVNNSTVAATIYASRNPADNVASQNPFTAAAAGTISFFADPGEYEIEISDLNSPSRFTTYKVNWNAVSAAVEGIPTSLIAKDGGLDMTALKATVQSMMFKTGDYKSTGRAVTAGSEEAGWLLCDGREVSRTTYSDLWAALGSSVPQGNGSTTFNLPDLIGRTIVGAGTVTGDPNRTTARARGAVGGRETHTLTEAELAIHTHGLRGWDARFAMPGGNGTIVMYPTGGNTWNLPWVGGAEQNVGTAGGGQAHNNMQPFFAAAILIKT